MLTQVTSLHLTRPRISIKDYRCPTCGKLLLRAHIPNIPGLRIEIRCKCARMVIIESGEQNVTQQSVELSTESDHA